MVFFFLLCCASSVRRPSRKSGAGSPPPWKCSSEGATSGRAGIFGDAVRAMERNAGQKKPDLKTQAVPTPTSGGHRPPLQTKRVKRADQRKELRRVMIKVSMNEYIDRPIVSLHRFTEGIGVSPVTTWRWRKNGWLKTINIAGRPYLTGGALKDFLARAEAGDFAKVHHVPKPPSSLKT